MTAKDEYKLPADEMWPEEVAHLFDKVEEGKPKNLKGGSIKKLFTKEAWPDGPTYRYTDR